MKNYLSFIVFGILLASCSTTNEKETRNLDSFDKVNLVGDVELNLKRNAVHSIGIIAKNASDIAELRTEVRNGELYIYNEQDCNTCSSPEYTIYLNHTGVSDVKLTGVITLNSEDEIRQKELKIGGNGILNGNLDVAVTNLNVDLNGISNLSISGTADTSDLKINGIGLINAASLKTKSSTKSSHGIAMINK